MYTTNDIQTYADEHTKEIVNGLIETDAIPSGMKSMDFIVKIWTASCWMNYILEELGASDEENEKICFAHGQRCFGSDPYEQAVRLVNEFVQTGTTKDRPGLKLAKEINDEFFH